jgi:hypothetical protein
MFLLPQTISFWLTWVLTCPPSDLRGDPWRPQVLPRGCYP